MSYLMFNQGDVLYVSKDGDNNSAAKGRIDRPWKDPWAAVLAMSAGDLIHIFPGVWTIGDVGSGADKESATITGCSLLRTFDQRFYFEPGARIEVIDTARVYELFPHTGSDSFDLEIKGYGSFNFLQSGKLFNIDTTGAVNVHFEADSVEELWYNRIATEGQKVSFVVRFIGTALTLSPIFDYGSNTDCNFYFQADNIIYGLSTGQDANTANGVFKIRRGVGCRSTLKIGNLVAYKKTHVGSIYSVGAACNGMKVDIEIGNLEAYDPFITNGTYASYTIGETTNINGTNGVATELGMLFRIPGGVTNGNLFNIKIGTLSSHHVIVGHQNAGSGVKNEINVEVGVARTLANNPLYFNDNGSNQIDELRLVIGKGFSSAGALIMEGTLKWMSTVLSGSLRTTAAGSPVIIYQGSNLARNPLRLENLKLINDGTVDVIAPITAANARSVIVNNVITNSAVDNGDVTEVGEAIKRDINYG